MPSLINEMRDVDVAAISLVKTGANGKRFFLFKQDEPAPGSVELPPGRLLKADGDWEVAYAVVAEPDSEEKPGMFGDQATRDVWASDDEIRKAAHRFMANGALINKAHESLDPFGKLVENAVALEDFRVGDETIRKGSWYVGIKPTDEGRAMIEKEEIGGVSIQGFGERVAKEAKRDLGTFPDMGLLAKIAATLGVHGPDWDPMVKRDVSMAERKRLAGKGQALPHGGFPIASVQDLKNAIQAIGRAKNPAAAKAHIIRRAKALGATSLLPDSWNVGLAKQGGSLGSEMGDQELDLSTRVENLETRLGEQATTLEKMGADLGGKLDGIVKKMEGEEKPAEDANETTPPEPEKKEEPTGSEEIGKRFDELAKSLGETNEALLAISKDVDKISEGGSSQPDTPKGEQVEKSDDPLAGLLD